MNENELQNFIAAQVRRGCSWKEIHTGIKNFRALLGDETFLRVLYNSEVLKKKTHDDALSVIQKHCPHPIECEDYRSDGSGTGGTVICRVCFREKSVG